MAQLDGQSASFIFRFHKCFNGNKQQVTETVMRWKDDSDTEEDIINAVNEFYANLPLAIELAYEYRLADVNNDLDQLKEPLHSKAVPSQKFEKDPSLMLINKLEDSLVSMMQKNYEKFSNVENICAYGMHITPWFGYADFFVRGSSLDDKYKYQITYWQQNAETCYTLFDRDHTDLEWFTDYLLENDEALYDESEIKRSAWDQWLRICMAIAFCGNKFKNCLKSLNLKHADEFVSDFSETFFVPAADDSGLPENYNYVDHIFSLKVANQNKLDIEKITEQYSWCIIPVR